MEEQAHLVALDGQRIVVLALPQRARTHTLRPGGLGEGPERAVRNASSSKKIDVRGSEAPPKLTATSSRPTIASPSRLTGDALSPLSRAPVVHAPMLSTMYAPLMKPSAGCYVAPSSAASQVSNLSLDIIDPRLGPSTRYVRLAVPGSSVSTAMAPRPLLLGFHGQGDTGDELATAHSYESKALAAGFVIAHPFGIDTVQDLSLIHI